MGLARAVRCAPLLSTLSCSVPGPTDQAPAPVLAPEPTPTPASTSARTTRTIAAAGVTIEIPMHWSAVEDVGARRVLVHAGTVPELSAMCLLQRARAGIAIWPAAPEPAADGLGVTAWMGRSRALALRGAVLECRAPRNDDVALAAIAAVLRSAKQDAAPAAPAAAPATTRFVDMCATDEGVAVRGRDGTLWWGAFDGDALEPVTIDPVAQISCDGSIALARTADGRLFRGSREMARVELDVGVVDLEGDGALTASGERFELDVSPPQTSGTTHTLGAVPESITSPVALGPGRMLENLRYLAGSGSEGCVVDGVGWLWCWGEEDLGMPPHITFDPKARTHYNDHSGAWSYGPAPILQLPLDPAELRGLEVRRDGGERICAVTDDRVLCLGAGHEIHESPTCTREPCSCKMVGSRLRCDDAPVEISNDLRVTPWVDDVIRHSDPCVITVRDEVLCFSRGSTEPKKLRPRTP